MKTKVKYSGLDLKPESRLDAGLDLMASLNRVELFPDHLEATVAEHGAR